MEEWLKSEICRVMKTLYLRGLVSALSGNVSARLPGEKSFWITPSGVFKGDLKPEHLLKLDLALNVLGEGVGRPSIEAPFHAAIYSARPDANAVVHAHNPFTVGLLSAGLIPRPITLEAEVLIGRIGVVPRLQPGSRELAAAVAERAGKGYNVILLEGHGVVGIGASLVEAEARIEALEENAIAMALSNLLGKM